MRRSTAVMLSFSLLAAACGSQDPRVSAGPSEPPAGAAGSTRYTTTAMVIETPDQSPELCLSSIAESYPPQCGGPSIIGWDWGAVDGEESAADTTWGKYTVVGTWDGNTFTLTEPPHRPATRNPAAADDRLATPCPVPAGGWQVVDETKVTDAAMNQATGYARSQPDVVGVWLDQSINPTARQPDAEVGMNDPRKLVLNLSFTGDLERHERAVRANGGAGALRQPGSQEPRRPQADRRRGAAEIEDVQWASIDEMRGRIQVGVIVDDGLQRQLDERYGDLVIEVMSAPGTGRRLSDAALEPPTDASALGISPVEPGQAGRPANALDWRARTRSGAGADPASCAGGLRRPS